MCGQRYVLFVNLKQKAVAFLAFSRLLHGFCGSICTDLGSICTDFSFTRILRGLLLRLLQIKFVTLPSNYRQYEGTGLR